MPEANVSCLVKAPISTIYRDGKPAAEQPVVGREFKFTESEMLRIMKSNPKALELPTPPVAANSVTSTPKAPADLPIAHPKV